MLSTRSTGSFPFYHGGHAVEEGFVVGRGRAEHFLHRVGVQNRLIREHIPAETSTSGDISKPYRNWRRIMDRTCRKGLKNRPLVPKNAARRKTFSVWESSAIAPSEGKRSLLFRLQAACAAFDWQSRDCEHSSRWRWLQRKAIIQVKELLPCSTYCFATDSCCRPSLCCWECAWGDVPAHATARRRDRPLQSFSIASGLVDESVEAVVS